MLPGYASLTPPPSPPMAVRDAARARRAGPTDGRSAPSGTEAPRGAGALGRWLRPRSWFTGSWSDGSVARFMRLSMSPAPPVVPPDDPPASLPPSPSASSVPRDLQECALACPMDDCAWRPGEGATTVGRRQKELAEHLNEKHRGQTSDDWAHAHGIHRCTHCALVMTDNPTLRHVALHCLATTAQRVSLAVFNQRPAVTQVQRNAMAQEVTAARNGARARLAEQLAVAELPQVSQKPDGLSNLTQFLQAVGGIPRRACS